jgi:ribosomal RNA-processing protein 12
MEFHNLKHTPFPPFQAIIPKVMGEVLLCLKDSNAKTRDAAYKLLLTMATSRDDITEFFKIVLAALGAQTPHMRSAAVMALSRLVYEYSREDETVKELLPHLMQTVAVLFDDPAREVNKSVIGFVRVAVAAMAADHLEPLLSLVIGGIMKYNRGKDRFRQKIKIILKKLVRLYGYDVVAPLVPEKDARLITHMRKLAERAARRKAAGLKDGQSAVGDDFDNMMESDEDDSDDGRTFMTGVTGFTKMTSMTGRTTKRSAMDKSVKSRSARSTLTNKSDTGSGGPQITAELNGEVLDLLDSSKMARSVRFADMTMHDKDFSDDEDDAGDVHVDNQGRIVISDGLPTMGGHKASMEYDSDDNEEEENLDLKVGGKRRRVSKFESVKMARVEKDAAKAKKAKNKQQQTQSLGAAYKSKKAGGDTIKKNQKYEPYAYVPLNAKDYTKKNRGKNLVKYVFF